jgi:beta-lactamase regulating signal transducer with metallopeptidase domain
MSLLIASLVDAALVLALGLAAAAALRRRSAALRHAVIASAIVAASLMPAFELLLPQLTVLRWQDAGSVISSGPMLVSDGSAAGAVSRDADPDAGVSWTALAALLWILGAAAIGAGLVTGLLRLSRLRRRCTPLEGRWRELAAELAGECGVRREVALLQSADPSLLVTCGVLNPAIILPATAAGWTDERRRIVLRHELAHIARHDAAVQLGGEALRILHWMNPLVWIACRRLRQESEYACDDAVLGGGVEATDYATHLLEVARQLSARHAAWAAAPAIAHPSTLERRIAAMLRRHQNRAPLGRRGARLALHLHPARGRRRGPRPGGWHRRGRHARAAWCRASGGERRAAPGNRDGLGPGRRSVRRHAAGSQRRPDQSADRRADQHVHQRRGALHVPRRPAVSL